MNSITVEEPVMKIGKEGVFPFKTGKNHLFSMNKLKWKKQKSWYNQAAGIIPNPNQRSA
jgi:hypothetical protein